MYIFVTLFVMAVSIFKYLTLNIRAIIHFMRIFLHQCRYLEFLYIQFWFHAHKSGEFLDSESWSQKLTYIGRDVVISCFSLEDYQTLN